jgi:hypothetical protein
MNTDSPAIAPLTDPFDIMLVGWSFLRSRLLIAAIELELFDTLESGPADQEKLQADLGLHPRGTRDFLDALTSLGLLERTADGYRNTPAASRYLVSTNPAYVGTFVRMTTAFMGRSSDDFAQTLRNGQAHGQDEKGEVPFAAIFRNPETLRGFLNGMDSLSGAVAPGVAEALDWSVHSSFADLGGARGNLASLLAQAHPHLSGVVLDRPTTEPFFNDLMADRGTSDRVRYQPGDFFVDDLPAVDVMVFGNVLHDFGPTQRAELIAKAARTIPAGGAVVVYDPMLDEERSNQGNLLLSLSLLLQSPNGGEYPPSETRQAMEAAGLTVETLRPLPASTTLVVGRKAS